MDLVGDFSRYYGVPVRSILDMPYVTFLAMNDFKWRQRKAESESMEAEMNKMKNPRGR